MRTSLGSACAAILGLSAVATAGAPPAGIDPHEMSLGMPPEVTVRHEIDQLVFADARGMVLYTYDKDQDTPGTSNCTLERHCSRQWPPLLAPAEAKPTGDWSVIRRQDGQAQWAYQDKPVYRYDDDLTPGTASGDNARRLWHTLAVPLPAPKPLMPSGFSVMKSAGRWVFANHENRALYALQPQSQCNTDCLSHWEPVPAAMLARQVGEWQPSRTDDGTLQWSFQGRPLYVMRAGQSAHTAESTAPQLLLVDDSRPGR